jgi:acyl-CoA synthetase (AMP-forming)/AMP-acid ligase II
VFPTEVENVLAEHPAVREVCVFGLPDPVWGDRIEAVISLKPQQSASAGALQDFCKDKIASFKIPKHIELWDELPKGATRKILKRQVIDLMVERYAKESEPES